MAAIILSKQAKNDLDNIYTYIFQDSPQYAQRQIEKILQRINRIGDFPKAGRVVPELSTETIREVFENNYRIIYRISSVDNVEIITILHMSRLFVKGNFF